MAVSEKYYLRVPAELFERVTGPVVSRRTDSQSMAGVETEGFQDSAEINSKPLHHNGLRYNTEIFQARPTGLEPATTGSKVLRVLYTARSQATGNPCLQGGSRLCASLSSHKIAFELNVY